jgi:hypothetical protein
MASKRKRVGWFTVGARAAASDWFRLKPEPASESNPAEVDGDLIVHTRDLTEDKLVCPSIHG